MSNEQNLGWLGYIGDYTTQLYRIIINHYKDPYKPTSIIESNKGFFHGSNDPLDSQRNSANISDWWTHLEPNAQWPQQAFGLAFR